MADLYFDIVFRSSSSSSSSLSSSSSSLSSSSSSSSSLSSSSLSSSSSSSLSTAPASLYLIDPDNLDATTSTYNINETTDNKVGIRYVPMEDVQINKVDIYVDSITGDISSKQYRVDIYTGSGNDMVSLVGSSNITLGSSLSASAWNEINFSSPISLTELTKYYHIVFRSLDSFDGSNFVTIGGSFRDYSIPGMTYEYNASDQGTVDLSNSVRMRLYGIDEGDITKGLNNCWISNDTYQLTLNNPGFHVGENASYYSYVGQYNIVPSAGASIPNVAFSLRRFAGDISSYTYQCQIWEQLSNNLNTLIGSSNSISCHNDNFQYIWFKFDFTPSVTLTFGNTYAFVVTISSINSSNYAQINSGNAITESSYGRLASFNGSGTRVFYETEISSMIRIWKE